MPNPDTRIGHRLTYSTMNEIINIGIHIGFLFIGLGAGFAIGVISNTGKGLALDLRDTIERKIDERRKRPHHLPPEQKE